jgi:hypothetical protein
MARATLNDAKLFLDDLIQGEKKVRRESLLLISSGAVYLSQFTKKRDEINALPSSVVRDVPLVIELRTKDTRHDDCGRALWYFAEAYKNLPEDLCPPEIAKIPGEAREKFVPVLSELQAPHSDEAARAGTRRPALEEMKGALSQIPLAGGRSLFDVTSAMLEAGDDIGKLLSERASQNTANAEQSNRQRAVVLLSDTLGLIRRCREQIIVEQEENPQLPSNLDTIIFDLFDLLQQQRERTPTKVEDVPVETTPTEPGKD